MSEPPILVERDLRTQLTPAEQVASANHGAREATRRAISHWAVAHATHPDHRNMLMISVVEQKTGRPVATGFGLSELAACNALLADLTERCRGLLAIRRLVTSWRAELRSEAADRRASQSTEFFHARKRPQQHDP